MDELLQRFQDGTRARRGRYDHFSREMRATAVLYATSRRKGGGTCKAIAAELGISTRTLAEWRDAPAAGARARPAAGFRAVRVIDAAVAPGALVLRGSGGWCLEGLSVDQAAQLVRLLGAQP